MNFGLWNDRIREVLEEFDKEQLKEIQSDISELAKSWDESERGKGLELPTTVQDLWELIDELLGDLPPRIIDL